MNGSFRNTRGSSVIDGDEYSEFDSDYQKFERMNRKDRPKFNGDKNNKKKWKPRQNLNFDNDGY